MYTRSCRTSRKMNWADTDVQNPPIKMVRLIRLPFVACFILVVWMYSVPMVSCRTTEQNEELLQQQNAITENNRNVLKRNMIHLTQQDKMRNSYSMHAEMEKWPSDDITNENGNHNVKRTKGKLHKRLKSKSKHQKDMNIRDSGFHEGKDSNFKYTQSEKKYFDYYPINKLELNNNETEVSDDIKVIYLPNDYDESKKQHKKKSNKHSHFGSENRKTSFHYRSKRSAQNSPQVPINTNPLYKRNVANYNRYQENFLGNNNQQGYRGPRVNFARPSKEPCSYYSYNTPNDPWNNQYSPLNKIPIAGIYYNTVSLPRGPSNTLETRSGVGEDRVVWDIQYHRPSIPKSSTADRQPSQSSTRRPAPPLIRNPPSTRRPSISSSVPNNRLPSRTPAPPLIRDPPRASVPASSQTESSDYEDDGLVSSLLTIPRTTTTAAATTTTKPPSSGRSQPARCVWAIVNCCSRDNPSIRYECFERNGCHGAFWDLNPCANEIQDIALEKANTFFEEY